MEIRKQKLAIMIVATFSKQLGNWSLQVVQFAKDCFKMYKSAFKDPLFRSLGLLFGDVVTVVAVIFFALSLY